MQATELLQMLRDMRDVCFATVDERGLPQVRVIDVMLVEDGRLYFCTARGKDFHAQLLRFPQVAIAGLNGQWQSVRLSGEAKRLPDALQRQMIDRIFEQNPSMEGVYPGESRYVLEAFFLDSGELELFDLGHEPVFRQSLALGGGAVRERGFRITDACMGCGSCQRSCPQKCIEAGEPFLIRQEACLRCGRCFELCPVSAIERR